MDRGTFKNKVEKELIKLSHKQVINFAWRCAIRALPFLSVKGNFDYWSKKNRQNHIYAIFYALDVSYANPTNTAATKDAKAKAKAAAADASLAYASNAVVVDASLAYAANAAYAVVAAVDAANAYTSDAAAAAAAHVYAFADDDAYTAESIRDINFKNVILQEMQSIRGQIEHIITTEFYGELCSDFHNALEAEGCAYWGELYKRIIDDGLIQDVESLKRRLSVPEEIRAQGAAAVANFLEELAKGARQINEARVIILGDKGAGKTSLARRLIDPDAPMPGVGESTAGVDTTLWELEKENINVRIWDFAGHTVTHAVHQFFLSERCLYILVYNGRTEEQNRLEYWLDHMKNYGGDSKAIILVNKRDQHLANISINALQERYPITGIYTFSIRDDSKKMRSFRLIVSHFIKGNPSWNKLEIPSSYYLVKEELENLFLKDDSENSQEHIAKDEFDAIANKHQVQNIESLLRALHSLGVSLWYEDIEEFDTLILNPEWISHGIYKIINWVNEAKKHSLTLDDFVTVFKDVADRYPKDKHEFLYKLMKHYELAYETEKENCLIIPHLLNEDRPKILSDFPIGESLMLRYKAEFPLPPNSISRFIVRHNQDIKKDDKSFPIVWRYGVVLEDASGSLALVREEDRTISVSVKGKDKTKYITQLRETLNAIFDSYKSEKPELEYRVERFGQISREVEEKNPLWLPGKEIINHIINARSYYDSSTNQDLSMERTVNNYNIKTETFLMDSHGNKFSNTNFNFQNCNFNLQGNLNDLGQLLTESGHAEQAKELDLAANGLVQAEKCKSPEEIQKKGIGNRLKRLVFDLENKDSKLNKAVKGIKNGVSIAQDIAKGYNDIAQWAGLPQVPKPFL